MGYKVDSLKNLDENTSVQVSAHIKKYGGYIDLDEQNNITGVGMSIGPGNSLKAVGTPTAVWSFKHGFINTNNADNQKLSENNQQDEEESDD